MKNLKYDTSSPLWRNINADKQFFFIHIPKAGGTSVVRALGLQTPSSHATFRAYQKFLSDPARYFSFTFVRNPWSRLVSFYRYAQMEKSLYHDAINPSLSQFGKHNQYDLFTKLTFKQMVHYLVDGHLVPYNSAVDFMQPQINWVKGYDNGIHLNFIGHLETLDTDFPRLCEQLGVGIKNINRTNVSGKDSDYRAYYDAETQHLVGKYYEEDVEVFKYSF